MTRNSAETPRRRSPATRKRRPPPTHAVAANGGGVIRRRNEAKILRAAAAIFAEHGFNGASTAAIARRAGVPKPNLHYYFRTKKILYESVLEGILETWLGAMDEIHSEADPGDAIARYIARKLESSRLRPEPSRLWAMEMLSGARHVRPFLSGRLRRLVQQKTAIIDDWIAQGKVAPVAPAHVLFMIWAMTQTYADFAAQIAAVLGKKRLDEAVFAAATETMTDLVLRGLRVRR